MGYKRTGRPPGRRKGEGQKPYVARSLPAPVGPALPVGWERLDLPPGPARDVLALVGGRVGSVLVGGPGTFGGRPDWRLTKPSRRVPELEGFLYVSDGTMGPGAWLAGVPGDLVLSAALVLAERHGGWRSVLKDGRAWSRPIPVDPGVTAARLDHRTEERGRMRVLDLVRVERVQPDPRLPAREIRRRVRTRVLDLVTVPASYRPGRWVPARSALADLTWSPRSGYRGVERYRPETARYVRPQWARWIDALATEWTPDLEAAAAEWRALRTTYAAVPDATCGDPMRPALSAVQVRARIEALRIRPVRDVSPIPHLPGEGFTTGRLSLVAAEWRAREWRNLTTPRGYGGESRDAYRDRQVPPGGRVPTPGDPVTPGATTYRPVERVRSAWSRRTGSAATDLGWTAGSETDPRGYGRLVEAAALRVQGAPPLLVRATLNGHVR